VTETDEVADAIDAALPLYPGESRSEVLRHLVVLGAEAVAARRGMPLEHVAPAAMLRARAAGIGA